MLHREDQGSGTELVLLHGWGLNSAVWGGIAGELGGDFKMSLLDLPGHGASPLEPGLESLESWARACIAAAPDRAAWIGWSLGGLVALQAALLAPERIRALVLVAATPRFLQAGDWPHAVSAATLDQFATTLMREPETTLNRFLALQVRGTPGARETLRRLRAALRERPVAGGGALRIGLDLLRDGDLRSRLSGLRAPTLWLLGSRDTLIPVGLATALSGLLPGARTGVLEGAGHAPFLSHGEAFRGCLREFLG